MPLTTQSPWPQDMTTKGPLDCPNGNQNVSHVHIFSQNIIKILLGAIVSPRITMGRLDPETSGFKTNPDTQAFGSTMFFF